MNEDRRAEGAKDDSAAERALERLFEHATPRVSPPAADAEEIRRAVYEEWDAATGGRPHWRRARFAAAASVLLALGWWAVFAPSPSRVAAIASVERVDGRVDAADGAPLVVGDAIAAGDVVATATGQVALRLVTGGSLRIGPQSRVELMDADEARLLAGMLYFDSENRRSGVEFTVATDLGDIRDVGTQFLAQLDDAAGRLDVGVRDGRVELTSGGRTGAAGVGERLVVTEDEGDIRRDSIPTFGSDWQWTERVAPPFDIEGRTVGEFLEWVASQTGRTIVFGDPEAEQRARAEVLRGPPIDLAPMQKLQTVLATTTFTYAVDGERVVIQGR